MISAMALCAAVPAFGQAVNDVMSVSVLPGWRNADGTHVAGIEVRLEPGWKTYWRQPGDAGIPPLFDWSASQNLVDADLVWPEPKVTWILGMRTIGYADRVVFPLLIEAADADPIQLDGHIQMGVCEEICIPVSVRVSAELPGQGRFDATIQSAIDSQVPRSNQTVTCSFAPTEDSMALTLTVPKTSNHPPELVVEVAEHGMWIAEPKVRSGPTGWTAQTEILSPSGQPTAVARNGVRVTAFTGDTSVEYLGCVAPG